MFAVFGPIVGSVGYTGEKGNVGQPDCLCKQLGEYCKCVKKSVCKQCGLQYTSRENPRSHLNRCLKKMMRCNYCEAVCYGKIELTRHHRTSCANVKRCSRCLCVFAFSITRLFERHVESCHNSVVLPNAETLVQCRITKNRLLELQINKQFYQSTEFVIKQDGTFIGDATLLQMQNLRLEHSVFRTLDALNVIPDLIKLILSYLKFVVHIHVSREYLLESNEFHLWNLF